MTTATGIWHLISNKATPGAGYLSLSYCDWPEMILEKTSTSIKTLKRGQLPHLDYGWMTNWGLIVVI